MSYWGDLKDDDEGMARERRGNYDAGKPMSLQEAAQAAFSAGARWQGELLLLRTIAHAVWGPVNAPPATREALEPLLVEWLETYERPRLQAGRCDFNGHDWTDHEPEGDEPALCKVCRTPMPHAQGLVNR